MVGDYLFDLHDEFTNAHLKRIKKGVVNGAFSLSSRQKNMDFIAKLGLSNPNGKIKHIITTLNLDNYYSGPEKSKINKDDDIYKFKVKVDDYDVYLKIGYLEENGEKFVTCISFYEWGDV